MNRANIKNIITHMIKLFVFIGISVAQFLIGLYDKNPESDIMG